MPPTEAAAPAVDTAFVQDFFPRWLDAWNSHDADRVLALMTEDIAYDDSAWPTTMHGHAEVREFLRHSDLDGLGHPHRADRSPGRRPDGAARHVRGLRPARVPRRQGRTPVDLL